VLLVFYGKGKGKTTAALGTVFRFLGYGGRVLVIQFMKSHNSGEYNFYKRLVTYGVTIKWYCLGTDEFVNPDNLGSDSASITIAKSVGFLLYEYPRIINEFKPELVVFDELGLAVHMCLIPEDFILDILSKYSKNNVLHAIVTGRYVPKRVLDIADLVTNCCEVKHYFKQGYTNIKGLDV